MTSGFPSASEFASPDQNRRVESTVHQTEIASKHLVQQASNHAFHHREGASPSVSVAGLAAYCSLSTVHSRLKCTNKQVPLRL